MTTPLQLLLRRHLRLFAVVLFVGLLFAAFELSGLRGHFSLEFLRQRIEENRWTGLALFVALFSLGNLIQVPGLLFLSAAVLTLGKGMGGITTYIAASTSCVLTFVLIRLIGGNALRQLDGKLARRLFRRLDAQPVLSVALLRVLLQTLPPLNFALALSGLKFRAHLVGTLLGLPLPIFLYCLLFDFVATFLNRAH